MQHSKPKIVIGSDHAGYMLKETLKQRLAGDGYEVEDAGTGSEDSTDYPDYAHAVARAVEKGPGRLGILMCGSGNGISMTANKHAGVRAALCWTPEIATLARQHNDANVLALPARFITPAQAADIVKAFLAARFEGGRHQRRVEKIPIP